MISGGQCSSSLFHEIKGLAVQGNQAKLVIDFQISFLERFYNLEELRISGCAIKELFCTEGDTGDKEVYVGTTLPTIRKIKLTGLHNLKSCLWKQDVQVDHILPNLETLVVHNCENLMSLGSSSASFQNLTTLEEIVGSEEDEATCDIIFSRLKSLELGVVKAPLLQSVEYGEGRGHWSGDLDSTVQQLHSTKVGYQGIGYFVLSKFSKSIEIWKENSLDFKNLTVVEVEECNSLEYIFSVSMALELVQLKEIKVKNCRMMEYIIKKGAEETAMDTVWSWDNRIGVVLRIDKFFHGKYYSSMSIFENN
ncbi:hypothetical protein V6N13_014545 [Hibiscus sabdariffa]